MTREEIYDAEIAPALWKISQRCKELDMPMVASVEIEPGHTGRTEYTSPTATVKQLLVCWAARCHGNVDSLFMACDRYARKHGHSSIYLRLAGNTNEVASGNETGAFTVTVTEGQGGA